jgi:hypothetical protein
MRYTKAALGVVAALALSAVLASAKGQAPEVLKATANVKSAGGATATAPVTITVKRKMSQVEAEKFVNAFKSGGEAALRKALMDVPTTGTVQLGNNKPTATRITVERLTDKGRLLTIIADKPMLFLGASLPGAKPTQGYNFSIIDLELDAAGAGSGTIAPAATIKVNEQGSFVVQDYSGELVKLAVTGK